MSIAFEADLHLCDVKHVQVDVHELHFVTSLGQDGFAFFHVVLPPWPSVRRPGTEMEPRVPQNLSRVGEAETLGMVAVTAKLEVDRLLLKTMAERIAEGVNIGRKAAGLFINALRTTRSTLSTSAAQSRATPSLQENRDHRWA